jgi:hypothetical protein
MPQATIRSTTLRSVMKSKAFKRGFLEARRKTAMDPDINTLGFSPFAYEWGRQFAIACPHIHDIKGRTVPHEALVACNEVMTNGTLI